jgi:hypothetical protein
MIGCERVSQARRPREAGFDDFVVLTDATRRGIVTELDDVELVTGLRHREVSSGSEAAS